METKMPIAEIFESDRQQVQRLYGATHSIEKRLGTAVNLSYLTTNQSVVYGDGLTYHWLLTKKTLAPVGTRYTIDHLGPVGRYIEFEATLTRGDRALNEPITGVIDIDDLKAHAKQEWFERFGHKPNSDTVDAFLEDKLEEMVVGYLNENGVC